MKRAVRRSRPCMSARKLEWSHTPARTAGWSICSSSPATPPTIMEVTSPWTRQATACGPNSPSRRGTTGLSPRERSLNNATTWAEIVALSSRASGPWRRDGNGRAGRCGIKGQSAVDLGGVERRGPGRLLWAWSPPFPARPMRITRPAGDVSGPRPVPALPRAAAGRPSEERGGRHARAEEAGRWLEEVHHPVEPLRHRRAAMRRPMDPPHVPLQQLQPDRPPGRQLRETEVLERHAGPGCVHDRRDAAEPEAAEPRPQPALAAGAGEGPPEGLGLDRAHRHALAVDRVEAADRVAQGDQPGGEAPEPVVAPPQAAGEGVGRDAGEGLEAAERLVDVGHGQRPREGEEGVVVARHRLVEEADQRREPPAALDREEGAVAPGGRPADGHPS